MANEIEKRIKEKLGVGAKLDADTVAAAPASAPPASPTARATATATAAGTAAAAGTGTAARGVVPGAGNPA
jgi:recombination protein RecA